MAKNFTCPVCGYLKLKEQPRSAGGGGSYEICPSCGFQFGVSDDDEGFTFESWRKKWKAAGAKWSGKQAMPKGWDALKQLAALPAAAPKKTKKTAGD